LSGEIDIRRFTCSVKTKLIPSLLLAGALTVFAADTASDTRPEADHKEYPIPGTDRSISHHNFTNEQIDRLRASIAKLHFPQPGGTVDKLLPVRVFLRSRSSIGDVLPNAEGLLTVHEDDFNLSAQYVLRIRQGHYATKSGASYIVDESAEIIPRRKLSTR
jgi:hypothetical protein